MNSQDRISTVNRVIVRFGSVSFVNSSLGFINSLLIVHAFGVSREIEIYFAATLLVGTIDRIFSVGTTTEILIPSFLQIKEKEGLNTAMLSFSMICNWFIIGSLLITLLVVFSASLMVNLILPGFTADQIDQVADLFCLLAIFIPLKIFNGMCSVPFRALEIYTVHEKTGIVNKIVTMLLLLFLVDSMGVTILVLGIAFGVVLRTTYISYLLWDYGLKYKWLLRSDQFGVRWLFKQVYIPFIQAIGLQVSRWIELAALSLMPEGSMAIYNYVKQLYLNYYSNISKVIGSVFLTEVSTSKNRFNIDIINTYMLKVSLICTVSLSLCISVGQDFLHLLWSSNNFGATDLKLSYYLLVMFFATMLMSMVENLYLRLNVVRGDVGVQYLGSLAILTLTSGLLYFLTGMLGFAAIITVGLIKGLAHLAYSSYVNYSSNTKYFTSLTFVHVLKSMGLLLLTFASTWFIFGLLSLNNQTDSRLIVFCTLSMKSVFVVFTLFLLNRLLNVYRLSYLIKN